MWCILPHTWILHLLLRFEDLVQLGVESYISDRLISKSWHSASYVSRHNDVAFDTLPYIFSHLTSWTYGQRMILFSRTIFFLSGVPGSRKLAFVDDLGIPQECLRQYDTKSPGHSKLFVNFNMAMSLWSKCGFDFTCSVLPALSMDSLSFSSWLPTLTLLSSSNELLVLFFYL